MDDTINSISESYNGHKCTSLRNTCLPKEKVFRLGQLLQNTYFTTIKMANQGGCTATHSDSQPYSKDELVDIIIEKLNKSTEEETLEFHDVNISTAWQTIDELERREEGRAHRYESTSRTLISTHILIRTTYDSLQKTLKLVIAPCPIHEIHFPWFSNQVKLYSSLTSKEKSNLCILPSPSKVFFFFFLPALASAC